jgi:phosphoserine phosphatase
MERKIRLAVFDVDGTLTPVDSSWRYLHDAFGTWEKGRIAARRYQRGDISYTEWAETDAKCWAGISISKVSAVVGKVPYCRGARKVFGKLRLMHVKTAIVSAGLAVLADRFAQELRADFVAANDLETGDGVLTGRVKVRVPVTEKAGVIRDIARKAFVPIREVALVGDSAQDLPLDDCLKIAYNPKDHAARARADIIVADDDLSRVLPYLNPE